MSKRVSFVCVIAALVLTALPVGVAAQEGDAPYWPTEGWRTSTPEEQGMDSAALAEMLRIIREDKRAIDHILIIRNGYVVLDTPVSPSQHNERHILYSGTDSITSILVGIALREGYIESVDQPILEIFSGRTIDNLDENKQALTVEHLLTMTSDIYLTVTKMEQSDDWVQTALDRPLGLPPGQMALFSDVDVHLLMATVQEATGMNALAYAQEKLFDPLGISDVEWATDPQGIPVGYSELCMTPHDLAKIGYLYLQEGEWNGQQVVTSDWVATSTVSHSKPYDSDYGYQWWVFPEEGVYAMFGWLGQWVMVDPDRDIVAVFLGDFDSVGGHLSPHRYMADYIQVAAESDDALPANQDGVTQLDAAVAALADPTPEPVPPLPEIAQAVDGQTYALTENLLGWESMTLTFGDNGALLTVDTGDSVLELPVGLDGIFRRSPLTVDQVFTDAFARSYVARTGPVALRGFWKDDVRFTIELRYLGFGEKIRLDFDFEGDGVSVWARETAASFAYNATMANYSTSFEGTVQ